jgi:hypothetical protein
MKNAEYIFIIAVLGVLLAQAVMIHRHVERCESNTMFLKEWVKIKGGGL